MKEKKHWLLHVRNIIIIIGVVLVVLIIQNELGYFVEDIEPTTEFLEDEIIEEEVEESLDFGIEGEFNLFDFSCSELREYVKTPIYTTQVDFINLVVNVMIVKECEIESKKEYTGPCVEIAKKLDDAFKRFDLGLISQNSYEIVQEEYNECVDK